MAEGKAKAAAGQPSTKAAASPSFVLPDRADKCMGDETCIRRRDPARADNRCTWCGMMADYQRSGDASILPNRGLCTKDAFGALCVPTNHAPGCIFYKPRRGEPAERPLNATDAWITEGMPPAQRDAYLRGGRP